MSDVSLAGKRHDPLDARQERRKVGEPPAKNGEHVGHFQGHRVRERGRRIRCREPPPHAHDAKLVDEQPGHAIPGRCVAAAGMHDEDGRPVALIERAQPPAVGSADTKGA